VQLGLVARRSSSVVTAERLGVFLSRADEAGLRFLRAEVVGLPESLEVVVVGMVEERETDAASVLNPQVESLEVSAVVVARG
jgi:hypothetical protein